MFVYAPAAVQAIYYESLTSGYIPSKKEVAEVMCWILCTNICLCPCLSINNLVRKGCDCCTSAHVTPK
jgi:hypothetical protein